MYISQIREYSYKSIKHISRAIYDFFFGKRSRISFENESSFSSQSIFEVFNLEGQTPFKRLCRLLYLEPIAPSFASRHPQKKKIDCRKSYEWLGGGGEGSENLGRAGIQKNSVSLERATDHSMYGGIYAAAGKKSHLFVIPFVHKRTKMVKMAG